MSVCNFTQQIGANECLGDSLVKINQNFTSLDEGLCNSPQASPGLGTSVYPDVTEQGRVTARINTTNNIVYKNQFDSFATATPSTFVLQDGFPISTVTFPYTLANPKPVATFSTVSLTNKAPTVTLYWMCSGSDNTTIYTLNSATSPSNRGDIWFNGPVNAIHIVGNTIYVGGEFTTVGGQTSNKFATINGAAGGFDPALEWSGQLQANPNLGGFDLGTEGSVNCITTTTVALNDFLIVGGRYPNSPQKGKGLTVVNQTTNTFYPFYVNGTVNSLVILGNFLYAAGDFDYINYGSQSFSEVSGLRVYTKGLAKIDLIQLTGAIGTIPNNSIDRTFSASVISLFDGPAIINTIVESGGNLYLGGIFKIRRLRKVFSQNLCSITPAATQVENWKPIVNGPVFSLKVNSSENYLYCGGDFTKYYTADAFNATPRLETDSDHYNLIAFSLGAAFLPLAPSTWRPKPNGPISSFAFDGNYVYCHGKVTEVNNRPVGYIFAIRQATFINMDIAPWSAYLETAPRPINNALQYVSGVVNHLLIGGTFTKINNNFRYGLAKVGVYNPSSTTALSSVQFEMGGQIVSQGTNYSMHNSFVVQTSSFGVPWSHLSTATFPINPQTFGSLTEGQMLRFFVRRSGTLDTIQTPIQLIGWKCDFN